MTRVFRPTPEQEAVIQAPSGAHLVIAPPGTGKTQVLIERIIWTLRAQKGSTSRVLALTFTTKAAENLRARVQEALGEHVRRVTALTFHGFCLDVLQHYGDPVEFAPDTTVYDNEDDRLEVLARAVDEEGLPRREDGALRQLLTEIGGLKRRLISPDGVRDPYTSAAYAAYDRVMRRYHACDFDDLLWLAWRLLTESPRVARHYRRLYRQIVVDEAQDTNRAQYEILRAICGDDHRDVMLVADGDQFIYRFAGASDQWLNAFVKDFGAQKHMLTANFRCAGAIIDASNRLIARNRDRLHAQAMLPGTAAPGEVVALCFADEAAEARGVTDWVRRLLGRGLDPSVIYAGEEGSLQPSDISVLGRNRYCLNGVRRELEGAGIPHQFNTGQRGLIETPPARLVYHGLRIIQNPADRVTKENILADWSPELLEQGVAELPAREFFRRLAEVPSVGLLATVLEARTDDGDVGVLVQELLDALQSFEAGEDLFRALISEDLRILTERWRAYRAHTAPGDRSLLEFLGELALAGKSAVDGPGVRVLTIHAAKGLEFRAVAIVGLNEGTFPDYRSLSNDASVAEERRGMYVAMTRASRSLLLTRPRSKRMPWGDERVQRGSRFLEECGLVMTSV